MMTHWKSIVLIAGVMGAWACPEGILLSAVADNSNMEIQEQFGPVLKLEGD